MKRILIIIITLSIFFVWSFLIFSAFKKFEDTITQSEISNYIQSVHGEITNQYSDLSNEKLQLLLDRSLKGERETNALIKKSFKGIALSILFVTLGTAIVFFWIGAIIHKMWCKITTSDIAH
jgi:hypothetical protein